MAETAAVQTEKTPSKVIVGCKLPHGFVMELIEYPEMKQGLIPREAGKRVTINGANTVVVQSVNPKELPFGRTSVDADFAREWFKRNKDTKMVREGYVFQVGDKASFKDATADRSNLRTKLEPLDPNKDLQPGVQADPDMLAKHERPQGRRPVIVEDEG